MKKLSYKAGIITGLFLYAFGAALFWPAAEIMNYTLFLIGLFIIAAGLGCSETAANPFVTVLGPESGGHFRLNLAQTFNLFRRHYCRCIWAKSYFVSCATSIAGGAR